MMADSHQLYDDRIYWKEAMTLKRAGYEVWYILSAERDRKGTTDEGIHFIEVGWKPGNNPALSWFGKRFLKTGLYPRMLRSAVQLNAQVYHLHDPRLLRLVSRLKQLPHQPAVVYDAHDPWPENIMDYPHPMLPFPWMRKLWSKRVARYELSRAALCNQIITTEENLGNRFLQNLTKVPVEVIYNYSVLPVDARINQHPKEYDAVYTGGITALRGAVRILEAVRIVAESRPSFRMLFVGTWFPPDLKERMRQYIIENGLEKNVELRSSVPFSEMPEIYSRCRIGLALFRPVPTHRIILPIKMFEYMQFGLPVVGSNFGHIHRLITKHNCGLTVDPENPEEIAKALIKILSEPEQSLQFSENGRAAVQKYFSWSQMEEPLLKLYRNLLQQRIE
ncbi:MAG: glycosyltransferase family 4 protein [Bacteroidales bacterium]